MADEPVITIEDFPTLDPPRRDVWVALSDDGEAAKLSADDLLSLLSLADISEAAADATVKASVQDTDDIFIRDSAASGLFERITALVFKLYNLVHPWTDMASAATTDLGSVQSRNVRVTGAVAITSFGTAPAGTERRVKFAGGAVITNGANIITPTGANITPIANEVMDLISEGAGIWRIIYYRGILSGSDWIAGTKTTPGIPTPAQISAAITALATSVGIGQTWQDLTASRAVANTYQNISGKPILVLVTTVGAGSMSLMLGSTASTVLMGQATSASGWATPTAFIVPPNWYFGITVTGSVTVSKWAELR